MGIVNRRNAFLGFLAWEGAKLILKRKAREVVPNVDRDTKRPNKGAIVLAGALLAVGAAFFWRSWTGGDEAPA
jgi:hypothetical protein